MPSLIILLGIVNDYFNYLLISMDLERLDLSSYRYNHVNITGYRIVDGSSEKSQDYLKKWSFGSNRGIEHPLYVSINDDPIKKHDV